MAHANTSKQAIQSRLKRISTRDIVRELRLRRQMFGEQLEAIRMELGPSRRPLPALIFEVLRREPLLTTPEIAARLVEGGWSTTSASKGKMVSACVSTLVKKGALGRRHGRFFLVPANGRVFSAYRRGGGVP